MALVFVEQTPIAEFRHSAFMAMRGSWNRTPPSGSKIVRFEFDSDEDTIANAVHDFCTGFISDTNDASTRWARPVGLALASDGSVYVSSDDIKNMIIKLTPPKTVSVREDGAAPSPGLSPNPASSRVRVHGARAGDLVAIVDVHGRVVDEQLASTDEPTLVIATLSQGVYLVRVIRDSTVVSTEQLVVSR
jgi:hypothetical protein